MQKHYAILAFTLFLGISFSYAQKPHFPTQRTGEKTAPVFDPSIFYPPQDQVSPNIYCLNGLSVNIMPTGMISLWATDFLLYVEDNITPVNQILIGLRKAGTGFGFPFQANGAPQINVIYDCNEQGAQSVELWGDGSGR